MPQKRKAVFHQSKSHSASNSPVSKRALRAAVYQPLLRVLPRRQWLRRVVVAVIILIVVSVGSMYGIARWYIASESSKPLTLGVSFIPDYAQGLGLDPHTTLQAMITQLGVKNFRLVSYWSDIESSPGQYNFSELDWEFQQIAAVHGTVSLSIGLRQPRWPECHMPTWASQEPQNEWYSRLDNFIRIVIERYRNNPSLQSYQLENEYFLKFFGQCTDFSRSRLVNEYNLVKQLDPRHTVIIARSNNAIGLPLQAPTPDEFGVSVYKRVWVPMIGRYVEYPFPAWFYGFLAGAGKILTGKDMVIHELQAEPWPPHGESLMTTPLDEQDKSLNASRLQGRFQYGEATGIRTIYMWGAEYWYYRLVTLHDASVWNTAQKEFSQAKFK